MGIPISVSKLVCGLAAAAAALGATAAVAADLAPTKKAPPAPAPVVATVTPRFFVKAGFLYAINQTSSKLYAGTVQIPGVGATVGDVATLGLEAGYYVTPDVSVDLSAGIPMWADDKTKGVIPSPGGGVPPVPSGTVLARIMPSFVPLTVLYHFNQFGAFQPYVGGGVAAVFSFQTKDVFDTGVKVEPNAGLVLQGGADYMLDQHWGVTFDVKKLFAHVTSTATGNNLGVLIPGAPIVANPGTQKTYFQPWVLSTGVTYRW